MEKLKNRKSQFETAFAKVRTDPIPYIIKISAGVYAFLLSHAILPGNISPFGVSLVFSVNDSLFPLCFIGSAIGYAVSCSFPNIIKYLLLNIGLRIFYNRISKSRTGFDDIWFLPPVTAFAFTFVFSFITDIFTGFNIKSLGSTTCEALLCSVSVYFLKRCFKSKKTSDIFNRMKSEEKVCLIYAAAILITSLSSFSVYDVSLSGIVAGALILILANSLGEIAGFVGGVVSGISIGIYTSLSGDIISSSLSGLMAGVFSPMGKIGTAASFIITKFSVFIFSDDPRSFLSLVIECALSIVIFIAVPEKVLTKSGKLFGFSVSEKIRNSGNESASKKLSDASLCLNDISKSIEKISDSLKKVSDSSDKEIYCRVQNDVCRKCRKFAVCWEEDFTSTYKLFEATAVLFRENDKVELTDLPKKMISHCIYSEKFLSSFENNYRRNRARREEEIRINNMRDIFYDQLSCMSEALEDFSKDFIDCSSSDSMTNAKIKALMKEMNIDVNHVDCTTDKNSIMKISANCRWLDDTVDRAKLTKRIEELTLRKFERPQVTYSQNGITVEFIQKPWLSLDIGLMQYPSDSTSICGDYCNDFYIDGKHTIIISDGMGTGGRAAVDSAMTAEFFEKLITNGFRENPALKIVNSAMLVKSSYESLSTIDSAVIDLFTGKVDFYKAGAAVSFIRKSGKCIVAEDSSLPIGILREIEFANDSFSVSPGDIILMVSDGVTANGTDWIKTELEEYNKHDAHKLAQKIALRSTEYYGKRPHDDITVVAAIVS